MEKATLVLEGGATRGVFTSGVLDYLMEKDLYMSHVIGVSAGSCNGVDYVSKQIGRTKECMIYDDDEFDYYFGVRKFVKEKSVLNMDLIFDRFPNEIYPFDYDTYFQSEIKTDVYKRQRYVDYKPLYGNSGSHFPGSILKLYWSWYCTARL